MLDALPPNPTRDELVYESLRAAILRGDLAPGREVVVSAVATQLGVSRIPVMHACQRLIGEGFLMANPRRSVVVTPLTKARIRDVWEVLLELECLAVRHACETVTAPLIQELETLNREVRNFRRTPGEYKVNRADYDFHGAVWAAAARPYLAAQIRAVYDHYEPVRVLSRTQHDPAQSAAEHGAMIEAIGQGDVRAAQAAIRSHRQHGVQRALGELKASGSGGEDRATRETEQISGGRP